MVVVLDCADRTNEPANNDTDASRVDVTLLFTLSIGIVPLSTI
jgi:hypothetical protein